MANGFVSESFLEQEPGKVTVMPGLKLQCLKEWYKYRELTHTFTYPLLSIYAGMEHTIVLSSVKINLT